jgi:hypothetical protein
MYMESFNYDSKYKPFVILLQSSQKVPKHMVTTTLAVRYDNLKIYLNYCRIYHWIPIHDGDPAYFTLDIKLRLDSHCSYWMGDNMKKFCGLHDCPVSVLPTLACKAI